MAGETGPRAAILGCAGPALDAWEREFFSDADPWGFILFARNIETPAQVATLVADLREAVGREAPVLIDQEGGRVARLRPPHWRGWSPMLHLLDAPDLSADEKDEALALRCGWIASELRALGIDVCCLPLLDVPVEGSDAIIGDRAMGRDPATVAARGRVVIEALTDGGVLPVIKHLPGHGRAGCDSHEALPRVDTPRKELETDFAPFRALADTPLGMTAHVVYTDLDPLACATQSRTVIHDIIRGEIGFGGLLMTDDLGMGALSGGFGERTRRALAAGCDIALHCKGDRAEMEAVIGETPHLAGAALARAQAAEGARRTPAPFDRPHAEHRLAALADRTGLARA